MYLNLFRIKGTVPQGDGTTTITAARDTLYLANPPNWNYTRTLLLPTTLAPYSAVCCTFNYWGIKPSFGWQLSGHINGVANSTNFNSHEKSVARAMMFWTGTTWIVF